eukprot:16430950-Heterocapsa_arctica.AAC.1
MYGWFDIIVEWLNVNELYGSNAYARAAMCSARYLTGYAAAATGEQNEWCDDDGRRSSERPPARERQDVADNVMSTERISSSCTRAAS